MVKKTKTGRKTANRKKRESKQRLATRRIILIFLSFLVITFAGWLLYCVLTLPDIDQAVARTRQPSTTITAENGNEVKTFGSVYSEVIRLNELPSYVPDAIISTEDRRFYAHFGFDIVAFTRAMLTNIFMGRYAQGGSTITQQVAKNLFLTSQKNIKRKTQELLLAFWLEHKFSKEQILTLYLNRVYLGAGTYGIEAASQKYFQKSSRDMNLLEAAIIAGMLKAPSRYNPIASAERAKARAKVVLQNMVNNDALTERQMKYALTLPVGEDKSYKVQGADYFADWVYREVNDYIGERDNDIYVYTTLDQKIQENAEKILREAVLAAKNRNVSEGAVVVLNKSGEVKAMVGGMSGVARDVIPFGIVTGDRGKLRGLNLIGLKRSGFAPEEVKAMTRAYMYIFKSAEGNFESRLAKAHEKYKDDALIMEMVEFIDDALKGRRNIMTAEA